MNPTAARPLHAQIAAQERWHRLRREFLGLMQMVHGIMFTDRMLSFLVVSEAMRCWFTVALKVPDSYPWARVEVTSLRVDFGVTSAGARDTVTAIARGLPPGELCITRFVGGGGRGSDRAFYVGAH
jgi:hypothetical protein